MRADQREPYYGCSTGALELRKLECDLFGELVVPRDVGAADAKPLEPVEQTLQFDHGECVGVVRHEFGTFAPRSYAGRYRRRSQAHCRPEIGLWHEAHQRARCLDSINPLTDPRRVMSSPAAIVAAAGVVE
jgi:hypothetical protein